MNALRSNQPTAIPLSQQLRPLLVGMLLIVLLVLVLTWVALQVQVAVAGLLNGESNWSKAEKQAVIDLYAYVQTGHPDDLAGFRRQAQIVDDYRVARNALASSRPEYPAIERMLARTGAMRQSIPVGLFVLRHFASTPYIHAALRNWRDTDSNMEELHQLALQAQVLWTSPTDIKGPAAQKRNAIAQRIIVIDKRIAPLTDDFSRSIALGAAWLARLLFWSMVLATLLMLAIWLYFARRTLLALRGSESRYRTLLEGARDAIVVIDAGSGRILEVNHAAERMLGDDRQTLYGCAFGSLFPEGLDIGGELDTAPRKDMALRTRDGQTVHVAVSLSRHSLGERPVQLAIMRDMSERLREEADRKVAAEALANIAEGVLIADASRRIISANSAAEAMTGYRAAELLGMPLEAGRQRLDGGPLGAGIWDDLAYVGHWQGRVTSQRKNGRSYPERLSLSAIRGEDGRPVRYVAVFEDISESEAYQRQLEHLALHDPLTDLLNRAAFERKAAVALGDMRRAGRRAAMLFIDLDGFKTVNDSYGHAFGDQLLQQVGQRLLSQLGEYDLAGRIGGDEFTVLLYGLGSREDALPVVRKLLLLLGEAYHVLEHEVYLSASIGVAGFPDDGEEPALLIANADAAMYAVKAEERNSYRLYSPVMQASTRTRLSLAGELRQAISRGEFHLLYQPSLDLRTRRLVAVEALLRWRHPERGEVSPAEFIPLAESLGMVRAVGEWVLDTVCGQVRAWLDAGLPELRVAVNISASHLRHPGFVDHLRDTLARHRCPPRALMIELTESAILHVGERARRTLNALHAMGVAVAVDDFGTGYSSLAYLKLPAIHTIKVDQSFVSGLPDDGNDAAITRAILALAASLGLRAIAEGIETESQRQFLLEAGCQEGQGYLFAHPLPASAIPGLLGQAL